MITTIYAQTYSPTQLIGNKYQLIVMESVYDSLIVDSFDNDSDYIIHEFTNTTLLDIDTFGNKVDTLSFPYYLSNVIPIQFDKSRVGKGESGQYLVYLCGTDEEPMLVYEKILKLTDNELILFSPRLPTSTGYDSRDKYRRVK